MVDTFLSLLQCNVVFLEVLSEGFLISSGRLVMVYFAYVLRIEIISSWSPIKQEISFMNEFSPYHLFPFANTFLYLFLNTFNQIKYLKAN